MKVVLLHQTIAKHDAIGNDIYHMYEIIKEKFECYVYCDYLINVSIDKIERNQLLDIISDKQNLVIYHHSVYWEDGEGILSKCKARVIIKYHNITPPEYFASYNDGYLFQCTKGREQTRRLYNTHKDALWICDSTYNTCDIPFDETDKKMVLPPFNNIKQWNDIKPDEVLLKSLVESKNVNLLFVGRVVPNKGHKHLIRIVKDYLDNYSNNICLYIVGKKGDGLSEYNDELNDMIKANKLDGKIKFIGEINDQILISYYLGCDFFICCSEHEGFCVPLLEAQYLNLPVIAMKSSAVADTLGENQIVLGKNIQEYSAAIKVLNEDTESKDFIIKNGVKNYNDRFTNARLVKDFKRIITEFTGEEI